MKKLDELTEDELELVFNKNEKLQAELYEHCYEDNMDFQQEVGEALLDYKSDSFSIEDYYSSFYLKLKDGEKFLKTTNLRLAVEYNCITLEDRNEAERLLDKYYNTTPFNTENYEDVDNITLQEIDVLAEKIMKKIEKYLHTFEDLDGADVMQRFIDCEYEYYADNDCYVDDNYIMYGDVAYTKCYA